MDAMRALAEALRRRERVDAEIAKIVGRPSERGHVGGFIASHIFSIALEPSASAKGHDGRFSEGPLAGATVNVKFHGKHGGMLDIHADALPDYFLVLSGPRAPLASSRDATRPLVVDQVHLFHGPTLVGQITATICAATSIGKDLWDAAEIFPRSRSPLLTLDGEQRAMLRLFNTSQESPERALVDPYHEYPAAHLRQFEEIAVALIESLRPSPIVRRTRDCIQIDWKGDEGVIVLITPDAVEVRLPTVDWTQGSYGPQASSRLYERTPLSNPEDVRKLVLKGSIARSKQFQVCRYCSERVPPEHRHAEDVCHGCAERHLGVVH